MNLRRENAKMVGKLVVIAAGMFAFGYLLIPIYKHICEMTGINILSLSERQVPGNGVAGKDVKVPANTQVDKSRTITVEFDANARGPWDFKPAQRSVQVHPGELTTVMYEFQNVQNRRMAAQVTTITLSYTFFEVGGKTPAAPESTAAAPALPHPAAVQGAGS